MADRFFLCCCFRRRFLIQPGFQNRLLRRNTFCILRIDNLFLGMESSLDDIQKGLLYQLFLCVDIFQIEVAGFVWNHWPVWPGIGGRNGLEYACFCTKRIILRSPVRENRTQRSVRGRSGNWQFYLDAIAKKILLDKIRQKYHIGTKMQLKLR